MRFLYSFLLLTMCVNVFAQVDSTAQKNLEFVADFRFRVEHDWDGVRTDGSSPDDRSRLRYRFRLGLNYTLDKNSSFGARIRSGRLDDQQGPHVTLGGNNGEFGLVSIGFEKLFYQYKGDKLKFWVGKNSLPLKKLNELFWNDNVFPEGLGLNYKFLESQEGIINKVALNAGHFIIKSLGQSFNKDRFAQFYQVELALFQDKFRFYPAFYAFRNVGDIPDGQETFNLDYSILHLGAEWSVLNKPKLSLGIDYYTNLEEYQNSDAVPVEFQDQTDGFVVSAKLGGLKKKGNWQLHLYYAYLQRYAVVDYFAQNDWVRWDYSSQGATGSRITNFQGVELRIGYAIKSNMNLILRGYVVEDLVQLGEDFQESGSRIRLDMNIKF